MDNKAWECEHEVLDLEQVHYCRYINLRALLGLSRPNVGFPDARDFLHPDEPQFIAVHQMVEIGFALHIETLWQLMWKMEEEDYPSAVKLVKRLTNWTELHGTLMSALKTNMEPKSFFEFRGALAPASGLESEQYRIIEILSGIEPDDTYATDRGVDYTFRGFLDRGAEAGEGQPKVRLWTPRLSELSKGNTVRKILRAKVAKLGVIHEDNPVNPLTQALIEYDKAFCSLRKAHMSVATRQIGAKPGTGHTEGVPYLKSAVEKARFFPELWNSE